MNKIEILKDIIFNASRKNKIMTVLFRKKSGEMRSMCLHRSRALEESVKGTEPESTAKRKWTLTRQGMLVAEELTPEKTHQWRTVNLATVRRIAVDGHVTEFER